METRDIIVMKDRLEQHYKLEVQRVGRQLIINIPNTIGYGDELNDRMEYIIGLTNKMVDQIRLYPKVFDIECEITYEFIKMTFI